MNTQPRILHIFALLLLIIISGVPIMAQQTDDAPDQIELAVANLAQRLREDVTLADLTQYEWSQQDFSDASLGCPSPGQSYIQVITPGYQFLLTYEGTVYDYRVSADGEIVTLCDTRMAVPDPTPTPFDPPFASCSDTYVVAEDDTLSEIAVVCNTTVAALMAANPQIPDPSLIFAGMALQIPSEGVQRTASIRPDSGPPGTFVRIYASGFPPGAQVEIGFGPPESEYTVIGTREIGRDGELVAALQVPPEIQPPAQRVAVVVLGNQETVSEVFTVTEAQAVPPATPTAPPDNLFEETQIYLIALGDAGRSGQEIGCGDSLVPVTVDIEPTIAPLNAALEELFSIDTRTYGQSGLYNALYQSDLTVESINIVDGEAQIALSGTLETGGVCDEPRVRAQLRQTALQYVTIDRVTITLNGEPLD